MSKWKPGDDYVVRFSDETEDSRPSMDMDAMVEDMRSVANNHGFDLSASGSYLAFQKSAIKEALAGIDLNKVLKDSAS